MTRRKRSSDETTARAFATSWKNVGVQSVYSREQFLDWFDPLDPGEFAGKEVLEMGFGNGSMLYHMADFAPARLCGIELADTLVEARRNLAHLPDGMLDLRRGDLTEAELGQFDLVYCIGVLHHLTDPDAGFRSVLRHTRPGGCFHCWVYAREGNSIIRYSVDPIRRVTARLPWWLTKYGMALPLVLPYYGYAKSLRRLARSPSMDRLLARVFPLYGYSQWIARRPFWFFHHVAFDQLVTPHTEYFPRARIEAWLEHDEVERGSSYLVIRNGNSWKFGGRRRREA